jgi:CO/xanthine dehydrogenase Mo-binding subunit
MSGWGEREPERVEDRIRIEPDGTVVALSGKIEFGQGIRTAFAQVVADEMGVPIEKVRVVLGDTDLVPWDMGTFGSRSVASEAPALRRAAAFARELRDRGAQIEGEIPDDVPLRPESERHYVGKPMPRLEARDIVTGRARYVADVRLDRMARGAIVRPPRRGAEPRKVDDAAARAMPGVIAVVREGNVIGVVAERDDQARAAAAAIDVTWSEPAPGSDRQWTVPMRDDKGVDQALAQGTIRLEAEYSLPPISNAPIGPSAAVADVRKDSATIYAGTQRPFDLRDEIAGAVGLAEDKVRVLPQMPSGTYGRNSSGDAPLEAALLSKGAGRPVLLQWTRAEEFAFAPTRPPAVLRVAASLDADGRISAWRYDEHTNVHTGGDFDPDWGPETSGRNALPHYRIPKAKVTLHVDPTPLRTASFRSLAAAENVFAIESFVDELARASGQEPLDFRLRHVDDERLRRVFERVAERSGWGRAPDERRGLGIAGTIYHSTYIAEVAEVEVDPSGRVRLVKVWAAIDPGQTLNPDGVRNQTEGGIQQSASWTLFEEIRHRDGRIANSGWDSYPIATFRHAPESIEVDVMGEPSAPPSGVGEPGAVAISAAIANAVFAATGVRVRELPMTPERVRGVTAVR